MITGRRTNSTSGDSTATLSLMEHSVTIHDTRPAGACHIAHLMAEVDPAKSASAILSGRHSGWARTKMPDWPRDSAGCRPPKKTLVHFASALPRQGFSPPSARNILRRRYSSGIHDHSIHAALAGDILDDRPRHWRTCSNTSLSAFNRRRRGSHRVTTGMPGNLSLRRLHICRSDGVRARSGAGSRNGRTVFCGREYFVRSRAMK